MLRSAPASSTSGSPGSGGSGGSRSSKGLGRRAIRELAERHEIRPSLPLGQHFLTDPNLARRIAALARVGPGDRVLEIGAGLGSLTVALAETGAEVLAIEFDRAVVPALREVLAPLSNARLEVADALHVDWVSLLGRERFAMASNLPYNVAVPVLLSLLGCEARVDRSVVMVQRELGERFVAAPGDRSYGVTTLKLAALVEAKLERRVPASVFWPEPSVESVLVVLDSRRRAVDVDRDALFHVLDEAFAERRKTIVAAVRRMGLESHPAAELVRSAGLDPSTRAEAIDLDGFERLTAVLVREGVVTAGAA